MRDFSVHRRAFVALVVSFAAAPTRATTRPAMTLHRSPSCGCCVGWARRLQQAGYSVSVINEVDMAPVKQRARVPESLQSCHTAFISNYVIEGHVPPEAIDRLLLERPAIKGLAVPDMPGGTPGMETPGINPEPFTVMAFKDGEGPSVFLDYPAGYRTPS